MYPCQLIGAILELVCEDENGNKTTTNQYWFTSYCTGSYSNIYHSDYCRAEREKCNSINCLS